MSDYAPEPSPRAGFWLDMTDKRPAETALLPTGRYVATITETDWTETGEKSKTPGATMVVVNFQIAAGEHDGAAIEARYFPESRTAGDFFYGLLDATGNMTEDDWNARLHPDDVDKKLLGATVVIPISQKRSEFSKRADGLRAEVGRAIALDSPAGQQVVLMAGYDDRMP